jgi:hypothetical protein
MRFGDLVSLLALAIFAGNTEAEAAQVLKGFGFCGQQMMIAGFPGTSSTAQAVVDDFHELVSTDAVVQVLESVAQSINRCPQDSNIDIVLRAKNVQGGNAGVLSAIRSVNGGQWKIVMNYVPAALQQEAQAKQNAAAQVAQQQQAAAAAQAREQRKQAAVNDCGTSGPGISGGPWLSSTYKTAVLDEVRRSGLFCVKAVEYVGAAVNPLGGNAARAKFTGYDGVEFNVVTQVRDFPY